MRNAKFVQKPSKEEIRLIIKAENAHYSIVEELGPLGFVILDIPESENILQTEELLEIIEKEKRQFKIELGNPHSCSCKAGERDNYCEHIAFIVLKKFEVPVNNELVFQTAWTDMELESLLDNECKSKKKTTTVNSDDTSAMEQDNHSRMQITEETYCAVCLEELIGEDPATLPFCSKCGNTLHERCLYLLLASARHNNQEIRCIYCRAEWEDGRKLLYNNGKAQHSRSSLICAVNCCVVCKTEVSKGEYVQKEYSGDKTCFKCLLDMHESSYLLNGRKILFKKEVLKVQESQRYELIRHYENIPITQNDYESLLQLDDPHIDQSKVPLPFPEYLVLKAFEENNTDVLFECELCECQEVNFYNLVERLDVENIEIDYSILLAELKESEIYFTQEEIEQFLNGNAEFFLPCGQHVVHAICALVSSCSRPVLRIGEEYYETKILSDICDICHFPYMKEWLRNSRLSEKVKKPKEPLKEVIPSEKKAEASTFAYKHEYSNNELLSCMEIENFLPFIRK